MQTCFHGSFFRMHCCSRTILARRVLQQVFRCYLAMSLENIATILIVFTVSQRQLLMTLDELLKDNKRLTYTPYEIRHRIRQLAYFRMIHESDLVCHQSTRMERRTFVVLCNLLRLFLELCRRKSSMSRRWWPYFCTF